MDKIYFECDEIGKDFGNYKVVITEYRIVFFRIFPIIIQIVFGVSAPCVKLFYSKQIITECDPKKKIGNI